MVIKGNKYGFADRKGLVFINIEFDYNRSSMLSQKFKNGQVIAEKNNKQGLIDKTGKYLTAKDYERIEPFSEGYAAVQKKNKWGYMDDKMKLQIQYLYQSADEFNNGIAKVLDKNGKIGFINQKGKTVISFIFDGADKFINGFCLVEIENKKGIIDLSGALIIACELDKIAPYYGSSILKLEKNSKLAYYNLLSQGYLWKEEGY